MVGNNVLFHHTIDRSGQTHPLRLVSINPALSQPEQKNKRKEVITSDRRSSFLSGLLDALLHCQYVFCAASHSLAAYEGPFMGPVESIPEHLCSAIKELAKYPTNDA